MASRDLSPSASGPLPLANHTHERPAERAVSGRIVPRVSWPRPATPTDLVPAWAGEFRDFNDWVSKATTRLTGTYDPLMGVEVPSICIDSFGRRCTMGAHFMRARDEGAFPVRFFWDCETPAGGVGLEPTSTTDAGRAPGTNQSPIQQTEPS